MFNLKDIKSINVKGKIVFLRVDLDVPIEKGQVMDDFRLNAWFPTLEYLVRSGAQVVIGGHLGRPSGKDDKLTLFPVASWIANKINSKPEVMELEGFDGWVLAENVFVLENLRFSKKEEENDPDFAKKLASLAQIYVNDAFASSHRAHASIVGITKHLPSFAGLHLQKEVKELSSVLDNPKRPLTVIIGGAKIETKLPLVEEMHKFADFVLVGGEITGNDKELARVAHEKIKNKISILIVSDLTNDKKDITENSTQNFSEVIKNSKTIVWNGPMGEVEKCFDQGTREVANAMVKSSAYTIVGGGDTVAFIQKEGLVSKFSFVSIGGGAMLEFLAGDKLPGLVVLGI